MKKTLYILIILSVVMQVSFSQIYMEKQTRHRFAQLNIGLDLETNLGGKTKYFDENNNLNTINLKSTYGPRFVIGGTHFWGHADFYIAIPLFNQKITEENQEIQYQRGVETAFKYYPWRIKHNKLRPYLGVSMAPFYHEQSNHFLDFGNGPELNTTNFPMLMGLTFNNRNHLVELGLTWNYSNKQDYYLSRIREETIETSPLYLNLSYKFMLETTLSAETGWESGQTKKVTEKLSSQKKLNGIYLGVGLSSAFWLSKSDYNTNKRPYITNYSTSIMPDFSIGYYIHEPDINIVLGYRGYGTSTNTYGTIHSLRRKSIVFETTKYLFDYHGFVPFLGPGISYENLSFKESFEGQLLHDLTDNKIGYGITFGWDIRPNRIQSWILRTNLRWFPKLSMEIEDDQRISFNNLEFNFIQLIIYPNRIIK